ncbi:PREDICTED: uncharacterized protein LOC107334744 [Acropora digitifera]|uniref:uncharacterized protein LOC107334744 n=1 Tax=Acropora digitifera TaxID=70779 RepID=UPI00077A29F7|nr:PREDICTED: uncharacterized protein LOC107334744 [Acropora digitifera]
MSRLAISLLFTIFLCFVLTSHLSSGRDIFHQFQDEIKDAILHNQDETENDNQSSDKMVTHLLGGLKSKAKKLKDVAGGYLNKAATNFREADGSTRDVKGYVNALGVTDNDIINYLGTRQETVKQEKKSDTASLNESTEN